MNPRATRLIFSGALAVDLLIVFALLYLTGGGESLYYLLFFPLLAINAYYFGRAVGLVLHAGRGAHLLAGVLAGAAPGGRGWRS